MQGWWPYKLKSDRRWTKMAHPKRVKLFTLVTITSSSTSPLLCSFSRVYTGCPSLLTLSCLHAFDCSVILV